MDFFTYKKLLGKVRKSVSQLKRYWLPMVWGGGGREGGRNLILCQGQSVYLPYLPKYWRIEERGGDGWWWWWSRLGMIRVYFLIWPQWLGNIWRQKEREKELTKHKLKILNYLRLTVKTKSRIVMNTIIQFSSVIWTPVCTVCCQQQEQTWF